MLMQHPLFQENWSGRRVLLLQGPVGLFFSRAAKWLRTQGATTRKLNFNGGDVAFFPSGRLFTKGIGNLDATLHRMMNEGAITDVWLFGDCRPIHRVAVTVAKASGVNIWVFEEGYFRPSFITCERGGVNGNTLLAATAEAYTSWPRWESEDAITPPNKHTYQAMALQSCVYWTMSTLLWPLFPFYRHHRSLNLIAEASRWIRGYWRKLYFKQKERGMQERLVSEHSGKFVLVPLQTHNDAQVTVHSKYPDVQAFIAEVIQTFAANAPSDHILVIKHHPMDRAYREYGRWIAEQARYLGITNRVLSLHDQHLPTLLAHATGAVVINSTVGLSAIHQGVSTHVTGKAFYGFRGLTHQGTLTDFMRAPGTFKPDPDLYLRFRHAVISTTQINDSFYKAIRGFELRQFKNEMESSIEIDKLIPNEIAE